MSSGSGEEGRCPEAAYRMKSVFGAPGQPFDALVIFSEFMPNLADLAKLGRVSG